MSGRLGVVWADPEGSDVEPFEPGDLFSPFGYRVVLFAVVREPRMQRLDVQFGGEVRYWLLRGDEVRAPAEALSAGVLTYLDMKSTYVTYDDVEAAYATYLDAESDFSLAGVA